MTAYNWVEDPKRLAFQYARYKHVAKILEGYGSVLEVGCADAGASRIVRQHVGRLTASDVDWRCIVEARKLSSSKWPIDFFVHDIMAGPLTGFEAVYCLDLFEHIDNPNTLLGNLRLSAPVAVIGTPSLESQRYASDISKEGHVNCVTKAGLRAVMREHWSNVFVFGMNDETLHTGFDAMCQYLLAVGTP
jgi:Methyltransferase domain